MPGSPPAGDIKAISPCTSSALPSTLCKSSIVACALRLIAAFLRRSSKAAGSNSKFLTNHLKWDSIATVFCLQKPLLHGFAFEEVGRLAFGDDLVPEINRNNDTCRVPLLVGNILNAVLIHLPYMPYTRAQITSSLFLKKIIDGHPPSWDSRFRFCHIATPIDRRVSRITGPIDLNDIRIEQIHVPHDQGATGEIVSAFCLHGALCCRAIVVLTAHFDRKNGGAFEKAHACPGADMIRGVRAQGVPVRQMDVESFIICEGPASLDALRILPQRHVNFVASIPRIVPCRRHVHNLPMHQFGLALHFIQIFYGGACFEAHSCSPLPAVLPAPATRDLG